MQVSAICAGMMTLSPVAIEAIGLIVQRMQKGQVDYGEPDVYGRDWVRELEEEVVDRHAYEGLLLVAHRRRLARGTVAVSLSSTDVVHIPSREFDVSDVER